MKLDLAALPNDVVELKEIVTQLRRELNEERVQALKYFEELQMLKRKLFLRSSEKLSEAEQKQLRLFNEAEQLEEQPQPAAGEAEPVEIKAHQRVRPGRKQLPADLPRVEVVHDIPESEKVCACGQPLVRIGEEISEKLDIIPAQVKVIRHVRPKYACKSCEGSSEEGSPAVKIAPAPAQLLPKSLATPGLLAWLITSKFCDALPYYRQETIFERLGIEISRQDMANWTIRAARRLSPLLTLMRDEIRAGPMVNIDETTVQVLDEPGRANTTKSYMWVFVGGAPGRRVIVYQYHPSRAGAVARDFLNGYRGFIQTDGYEGYSSLGEREGIVHVGCWAHARRKFFEAKSISKKAGSAEEALSRIGSLYRVEKSLRSELKLGSEQFAAERRRQALPILDSFHGWLEERSVQVPPSTLLGKAISYAIGEWPKLVRYLDSPELTPDNNVCENAIRPFVIGRKNWLFSGSPVGAYASAALYSLIETAKANDIEPYLYLRHVFSNLPEGDDLESFRPFLPNSIKKEDLLSFDRVRLV